MARSAGIALLGVGLGLVGSGVHRLAPPWGVIIGYLMVALAGVVVVAWTRKRDLVVLAAGVAVASTALMLPGPGGHPLVFADVLGWTWLGGGLAAFLALATPRAWLSDAPTGGRKTGSRAEHPGQ